VSIDGPWRRVAAGAGLLGADGAIRTTVFSEMTGLAVRTGAINLGQGAPDEEGPSVLIETARQSIAEGLNQYPPGRGMPALLDAIARHQRRFWGFEVDPETEVLVTVGATEALAATLLALVEPGDDVVVLEPFYDSYAAIIALAGARLVPVPLEWPAWGVDADRLRAAVTDRTRIILVNDPHNPTGSVLDAATRALIVELAARHDALIVTDEVYEHLRFDGGHVPIATLPEARERTITISSAGKTFSATGWKIGWLIAPAPLVAAVLTVKQYLTFAAGSPFQPAVGAALDLPDAYFEGIAADLTAKRDLLSGALASAGLDVSLPAGSYFVVADARPLGGGDASAFVERLATEAGVVGIPVSAFAADPARYPGLVRFAFCKRADVLRDAAERLVRWRSDTRFRAPGRH